MDSLVQWFTQNLSPYISEQAVIFIISLLPILELRGASLLKVPYLQALPICVIGNLLPIPFILLFIKQIFKWLKKTKVFRPMVEWLENKAMKRSDNIKKGEFWGLVAFVGIPLPGTGAWTGALIASLLGIEVRKSSKAILLGIAIAAVIMSVVSYGVLGNILG